MPVEQFINPGGRRGPVTPEVLDRHLPVPDVAEFGRRVTPPAIDSPAAPVEPSGARPAGRSLREGLRRPTPELDELAELDALAQLLISFTYGAMIKFTEGVAAQADPPLTEKLDALIYRWAMRHLGPPEAPQQPDTNIRTDQESTSP